MPMKAKQLKPGDYFLIPGKPDPEGGWRLCLTNNKEDMGIRFGFPHKPGYWCYMGEEVEVELVPTSAIVEAGNRVDDA